MAGLAVVLLSALTSCGSSLDERRATVCRRAVPALVPKDAVVSLLRIGSASAPDSIRVDYRLAGSPDTSSKARWIVCSFGPGSSLDAIATESGPLNGASVYLLRHYYLDTPEAAAADPGSR
ncbi:hypothetical protein [Methylobacterium haplocladii]|uniref:Uncharacterized protein n=1 Tax=Methylobacterium haplocladii TaxID=1176176 RepID=A0A512IJB1_9HYPH|nr:hypothetical protein [Methylobacterium haplocladii]GEO97774.1 hypothetical protein MHA02_01620 [Methylobacterium haplocladii]GJD82621.1 hypothetical protein HPGCJGGD_0480 [Methylobacterium haplocladii]GLS57593.1 hypothetical protein GCM10007887_02480 [Methylobacterium haplocladii]